MKYKVHLFPVVRVTVEVEADSQQEAIEKAEYGEDFHLRFDRSADQEWAEEVAYYEVDEVGDEEYSNSHWYKWHRGELVLDEEHA